MSRKWKVEHINWDPSDRRKDFNDCSFLELDDYIDEYLPAAVQILSGVRRLSKKIDGVMAAIAANDRIVNKKFGSENSYCSVDDVGVNGDSGNNSSRDGDYSGCSHEKCERKDGRNKRCGGNKDSCSVEIRKKIG